MKRPVCGLEFARLDEVAAESLEECVLDIPPARVGRGVDVLEKFAVEVVEFTTHLKTPRGGVSNSASEIPYGWQSTSEIV